MSVTPLITLEEAREQIRSDTDYDDSYVDALIRGASSRVIAYVDQGMLAFKDSAGVFLPEFSDSAGTFLPPEEMKIATRLLVGYLYQQRDEDGNKEFDDGQLPRPVRAMLLPLRPVVMGSSRRLTTAGDACPTCGAFWWRCACP